MPWKQDLSKLKQQLKEDPPAPPPPAPRKIALPPALPTAMADEDALFLSAMGLKRPPAARPSPAQRVEAAPPPVLQEAEVDFASAMSGLGGLKPLPSKVPEGRTPLPPTPAPISQVQPPPPVEAPTDQASAEPEAPLPLAEPSAGLPMRIQLAAGMAIEVDGHLDLRGHSRQDAVDRLRDRLEDGRFMHWRSLHVTLGPDPDLHGALQELLGTGGLAGVQRYAQAPVPMGGAQAWILYLNA